MNNYEKIKNMTLDEMARFLYKITDCQECLADTDYCNYSCTRCLKTLKQWLQAESEDNQ